MKDPAVANSEGAKHIRRSADRKQSALERAVANEQELVPRPSVLHTCQKLLQARERKEEEEREEQRAKEQRKAAALQRKQENDAAEFERKRERARKRSAALEKQAQKLAEKEERARVREQKKAQRAQRGTLVPVGNAVLLELLMATPCQTPNPAQCTAQREPQQLQLRACS